MSSLLTLDYTPAAAQFQRNMHAFRTLVLALADSAVRQSLDDAGRLMDSTVPVDTGALRANRSPAVSGSRGNRITWSTGYTLPYAGVLEYGGYPGVGPKTVALGGGDLGAGFTAGAGIYAKQSPLGWVRKALAAVRDPLTARIYRSVRQAWMGQVATGPALGPETPILGSGGLAGLFGVDLSE